MRKREYKSSTHEAVQTMIKTLMEKRGLSQERLAALIPVSTATVNRWALGKTTPSMIYMHALKRLLDEVPHD